jgi:hypothetical protein
VGVFRHNVPRRWFGCGRPVEWSCQSADLNPLGFFLWGFSKHLSLLYGCQYWHTSACAGKYHEYTALKHTAFISNICCKHERDTVTMAK